VDKGPWEPDTPPTWEDVVVKFRANVETVLPPTRVDQVIDMIGRLEDLEDIAELMSLLSVQ
jgi:2-methylcitrate dehydratase PrpD